jgi:type II secretory pathway pseudopilin PulG
MRDRLLEFPTLVRWGALALRRRFASGLCFPSEAGFAVPTVTLMLLAAMGMAGVAITTSIGGQSGAVRDRDTKTALAVAESGVERALLQFNEYGLVPGATPCAPVGGTLPDAQGWCPEVSGTVNGAPVSYWVKPTSSEMPNGETAWTEIEVVSAGTLAGVTRRVDFTANSSAGQDIFVDATVQAEDGIELDSNAEIHAGAATNGNLTIGSNAKQCGTATVGIGKEKNGQGGYYTDIECGLAGGDPAEDEIDLPPVIQGEAATVNDNGRLFTKDQISGNKKTACFNGFNGAGKADASCGPRELVVGSNGSVTLGGSVYSFCKVTLKSNSSLYIAPGAKVGIYFDSPEACGYEDDPVTQLELLSNSRITPQSGNSGSVALLFVGSPNHATNVVLNSETSIEDPVLCAQNFVIYGPYTDIEMDSNTSFCGAMAGKTIHLDSNAEVWTSSGVQEFFLPLTAPHYVASRFVDCIAAGVTGSPDEGC